jgi:hypothetical protein
MMYVVFGAAGVLLLLLVIWAGHRMLRNPSSSGGMADGLGSFIDVFDPARARADEDLKSKENQGEIIPRPEDDDLPIQIDHVAMRALIRRPASPKAPTEG